MSSIKMENKKVLTILLILIITFRQLLSETGQNNLLNTITQQTISEDYGLLEDYFSKDFDENQNCADEEKILKLRQNNPDNCVSFSSTEYNQETAYEDCMYDLLFKLQDKCDEGIKSEGNVTYCMKRGISTCCFSQGECHTKYYSYLKGKDEGLTQYVKYGLDTMADFIASKKKFKACFKTQGYDTGICEAECKKLKSSQFAKNCSKKVDGHTGVFKCCVVPGNKGCDICNYCCILPVCSRGNGTDINDEYDTELMQKTSFMNKTIPDELNIIEAKHEYDYYDNFCVPRNYKRGNTFYRYNMKAYTEANSTKDMKKIPTDGIDDWKKISIYGKYIMHEDVNYLNAIYNPKFRLMVKNGNETILKMYAELLFHDYCFKLHKYQGKRSKCVKQCKKLKKEKPGKECKKKKNSLFKCCIKTYNIEEDEIGQMKAMKTLNETLKRPCRNGKCYICCVTGMCSYLHNGNINQNTSAAFYIGDLVEMEPVQYESEEAESEMTVPYSVSYTYLKECKNPNKNLPDYWPIYNMKEYHAAYTKDMMCRVSLEWNNHTTIPKKIRGKLPKKQKINKKCDRKNKERNKKKLKKKKKKKKKNKKKKEKRRKRKKKKYINDKTKGKRKKSKKI